MPQKFYMGGVCGMGMAPLAAFLNEDNNKVSGFDDCANIDVKSALKDSGINVDNAISSKPILDVDYFVISTALASRQSQLQTICPNAKIVRRGECWAEICKTRKLTAIVGSHGKSTVSALVAHAIEKLSLPKCGYLVGAIPNGNKMHKHCAQGEIIVSEIDESDGTIEEFSPEVTVALNADLDHTNIYANSDMLEGMFERLFARTKRLIIYPANDSALARIAKKSKTPSVAIETSGNFVEINKELAHAALEATFQRLFDKSVFDSYKGLLRRQETLADTAHIFAMADYAHHPNEVKSFLAWFMNGCGAENPLIFFQPHRYSRTRRFAQEFAAILKDAAQKNAKIVLLPVYAASENFDELGTSLQIAKLLPQNLIMLANTQDFAKIIESHKLACNGGKISVAIVGAGDFYFQAKKYFEGIK